MARFVVHGLVLKRILIVVSCLVACAWIGTGGVGAARRARRRCSRAHLCTAAIAGAALCIGSAGWGIPVRRWDLSSWALWSFSLSTSFPRLWLAIFVWPVLVDLGQLGIRWMLVDQLLSLRGMGNRLQRAVL